MGKTKIAIVGIGGVGGYYGGLLAAHYEKNPDFEVSFVARGEHLKKIKENGLTVITETSSFIARPTVATDNASELGTLDYIILASKSYDLEATVEQIKPCIGPDTVILPLLNGIDNTERIRALLHGTEVWSGCVYIVGRLNEPGVVESSGGVHDLFFGYNNTTSEKLLFFEKVMKAAGIKAIFSEKILTVIWKKFFFISITATLTSYFNVGFRDLLTDELRKATLMRLMDELLSVAVAEKSELTEAIKKTTIQSIERLPFGTTSSMHTDFSVGKSTELDTLCGVVIKTGAKHGIALPLYQKIFSELKNR